jgi:hypothetical protein
MAEAGLWWWRRTMPRQRKENPDAKTYEYSAHHSVLGFATQ